MDFKNREKKIKSIEKLLKKIEILESEKAFLELKSSDYEARYNKVSKESELKDQKIEEVIKDKKFWENESKYCPMTHLYNRAAFNKTLPEKIKNTEKEGDLSLISLDIDYFKKINDKYGHIAGDQVLKQFAQIIYNNVRHKEEEKEESTEKRREYKLNKDKTKDTAKDYVARPGGEEFAVIASGTDLRTGIQLAYRIKKAIANSTFNITDKNENPCELKITTSVGVSNYKGNATDMESLLNKADRALYWAKKAGRNKVRAIPPNSNKDLVYENI